MSVQNERPFRDSLHDLAIQKGMVTGMGSVNWSLVAQRLPTIHYETLRKLLAGQRHLDAASLEEIAAAMDVPAEHFAEYRLLAAQRLFDANAVGYEQALENLREYLAPAGVRRNPKSAASRRAARPAT